MDLDLCDFELLTFIDLLKTQLEIFSQENKTSLLNLVNNLCSDNSDKEEMANKIVFWYQGLPEIEDAMLGKLANDQGIELITGGQTVAMSFEEYKEQIKKALS